MKPNNLENHMAKLKTAVIKNNSMMSNVGYGNGYVIIPMGHILHGLSYDDIMNVYDINAHGGLTYASMASEMFEDKGAISTDWVIGFDTAHSGDSLDNWPDINSVDKEARRVAEQCQSATVNIAAFKEELNELLTKYNMI